MRKRLTAVFLAVLVFVFSSVTCFASEVSELTPEQIAEFNEFCPLCDGISTYSDASDPSCLVFYNSTTGLYTKLSFSVVGTSADISGAKMYITKSVGNPAEKLSVAIENIAYDGTLYVRACSGTSLDNMSSHKLFQSTNYYKANDCYYISLLYGQDNGGISGSNVDMTGIDNWDEFLLSVNKSSTNLYRYKDDTYKESGEYSFFLPIWERGAIVQREVIPQVETEVHGTMEILVVCGVGCLALLISLVTLRRLLQIYL